MKKRILIMVIALIMAVLVVTPVLATENYIEIITNNPVITGGDTQGETGQASGSATINYNIHSETVPSWSSSGWDYVSGVWSYTCSVESPSGVVTSKIVSTEEMIDIEEWYEAGKGANLNGTSGVLSWDIPIYFGESGIYTVNQDIVFTSEWGTYKWHWDGIEWIMTDSENIESHLIANKSIRPEKPNHIDMPSWYPMQSQFGLWFGGMWVYNYGGGNTLPTIEKVSTLACGTTIVKTKVNIEGGTHIAGGNILRVYINTSGDLVVASTNGKALSFDKPVVISVWQDGAWVEVGKINSVLVAILPLP